MRTLVNLIKYKIGEEIEVLQKSYCSLAAENFQKVAGIENGLKQALEIIDAEETRWLKGDGLEDE